MYVAVFTRFLTAMAVIAVLVPGVAPRAAELRIAVAANFLGTLQRLAPPYEQISGTQLLLSAASSGQLYAQIVEGAPFDIFLSADSQRPLQLEQTGRAEPGSRFTYAIGQLVLWSPAATRFTDGAAYLRGGQYRYLAIANPDAAPYGLAAQQVLQNLQLWDQLQSQQKIVTGASLAQTRQFAASGNADAAFVAWSQLLDDAGKPGGSYWLPAPALYQPILQQAVLLSASHSKPAARHFLNWLQHDPVAAKTLRAAGYGLPAL
jgi:molybdate transport system substrate-binding protein